jgi:hypothetical protein
MGSKHHVHHLSSTHLLSFQNRIGIRDYGAVKQKTPTVELTNHSTVDIILNRSFKYG